MIQQEAFKGRKFRALALQLENKMALITGASGGIGQALAFSLAGAGAFVRKDHRVIGEAGLAYLSSSIA